MKMIHYLLGLVCTFCVIIILLITSVEAVVYWTPGYFEKEYAKYHVTETVRMDMNDLLYVTEEMMDYLRGNREDLIITTTVDGQQREFFNQREIDHMVDVRNLFLAALVIRRVCAGLAVLVMAVLFFLKAKIKQVLPRAICGGTILFFLILAVLAGIISTDFTKYFIVFHHILFTNSLWILDPATDLLINIVPEAFFVDTALRIALTFAGSMLLLFFAGLAGILKSRKGAAN